MNLLEKSVTKEFGESAAQAYGGGGGGSGNAVSVFVGILVTIIIVAAVAIPISNQVISQVTNNSSGLDQTTKTVLLIVPTLLAVALIVLVVGNIM